MQKVKRLRKFGNFTLSPDVADRLRTESEKTEVPMSRLADRALRSMFGMPKASQPKNPDTAA